MDAEPIKSLALIVKSPAGVLYERSGLRSLQLELRDGKLGIRAGHAPLIAEVSNGDAVMDDGISVERIFIQTGVAVVQDDKVMIYTHSIDPNVVAINSATTKTDDEFDDLFKSIVSTLMPGSTTAEYNHGS